jgi:hypothetical protein
LSGETEKKQEALRVCVVGVLPDFEPASSRVPVKNTVRLAKFAVLWSVISVSSVDQQLYIHFAATRSYSLASVIVCRFILSIQQFILNIANLLHRLTTEARDDYVRTRNPDVASRVA